jgi:type II secretory pathway component PulF
MSPQKQVNVSSICLAVMILLIFAYGLLIFYVPVLLETYDRTGESLSPFLRIVIIIGHVINKAELLIVPAIFLALIASLIWRIQSSIKLHQLKK